MNEFNLIDLALIYPSLDMTILKKNGFTFSQIDGYVKKGFLEKVDKHYYIKDNKMVIKLYDRVGNTWNWDKKAKLLDLSLSIDPSNKCVLKQRMYNALRNHDYSSAIFCFEKLYLDMKVSNKEYALIFLFLFSKITTLNGYMQDDLDKITENDLYLSNNQIKTLDKVTANQGISLLYNGRYNDAYKLLFPFKDNKAKLALDDEIFRVLLRDVLKKQQEYDPCEDMILEQRFEDALDYLNNCRWISPGRREVRKILELIVNPPEHTDVNLYHKDGLWESIEANDYVAAYNHHVNYVKGSNRVNSTTNMMTYLLRYIVMGILNMSEEEFEADPNIYKAKYISYLMNHGYAFEEALKVCNFDEESKKYIILMFASYSYHNYYDDIGDRMMNMYPLDKTKTTENNTNYYKIKEARRVYIENVKKYQKSLPKVDIDLDLSNMP